MDLRDLCEAGTADLQIKQYDGSVMLGSDGKPWTITLAGPTHAMAYLAEEEIIARRFAEDDEVAKTPAERADAYITRSTAPLVTRTLGWSPIKLGGQDFEFTLDNCRKLYRESDTVRRQVQAFILRSEGFRKKSSIS